MDSYNEFKERIKLLFLHLFLLLHLIQNLAKPVYEEPSKPVIVPPVDITVPVVEDTYPINIVEKFIDYAQYVHEVMDFNQIVIHHTAGGSAQSTINWWNSNKNSSYSFLL